MNRYFIIIVVFGLCLAAPVFAAFPDVPALHPNAIAIDVLKSDGIVAGYPDGTFGPENTMNRAEFSKVIIGSLDEDLPETCISRHGLPFPDVYSKSWFAEPVCRAHQKGLVKGYPDGLFRPANTITFVEAAAVLARAFDLAETQEGEEWYVPVVRVLGEKNVIPISIRSLTKTVTRGEMAEMLYRLRVPSLEYIARSAEDLLFPTCELVDPAPPSKVDMDQVRKTWLAWVNIERRKRGLVQYAEEIHLDRTAAHWALENAKRGEMSHKREGQTEYYDFERLTAWFADFGLEFGWSDGYVHTENIARGMYACDEQDCTQELIDAMRESFDAFMAEEPEKGAHFTSMINPQFRIAGVGLVLDGQGRYYLVLHYATWITSVPPKLCE